MNSHKMNSHNGKLLAVIGSSAAVTLGVLGAAVLQSQAGAESVAGPDISTGVTITKSTAPPVPETAMAVPGITGPAPLPSEEQGLPG